MAAILAVARVIFDAFVVIRELRELEAIVNEPLIAVVKVEPISAS